MSISDPELSNGGSGMTESEAVVRLLGNDPWMRFDVWASRAWEASERAIAISMEAGAPISSDDSFFDPRVGALFHAASIAKEFAEMVNPVLAVSGIEPSYRRNSSGSEELILDMVVSDTDDFD